MSCLVGLVVKKVWLESKIQGSGWSDACNHEIVSHVSMASHVVAGSFIRP